MKYKEWAKEYYDCAADLRERTEKIKEEMKEACEPRLSELADKLRVTYEMYLDCMHIADMLAKRKGEC